MEDFLRELGLEPTDVTSILVSEWGTKVTITFVYDPTSPPEEYRLTLHGCSHIRWDVHGPERAMDPDVAVIGLELHTERRGVSIGEGDESTAVLYTNGFELSVSYKDYVFRRQG